jgi:hypothetical protein
VLREKLDDLVRDAVLAADVRKWASHREFRLEEKVSTWDLLIYLRLNAESYWSVKTA